MKNNEVFHKEELHNPKRPRKHEVISQAKTMSN